FKFRKPAAFLLDEKVFEATHGLCRGHELFPWRHALSKQNAITLFLRTSTRCPIFQMHHLDASRVGVDTSDRVSPSFFTGAERQEFDLVRWRAPGYRLG